MGEELKVLDSNVIMDTFFLDNLEIAVINPTYLESDDVVRFGKIIFDGNDYILEPLTEEESNNAIKKYNELIKLFVLGVE